MSTELQAPLPQTNREGLARTLRPAYFERRDSLIASGALSIEDRRTTYPPTGRVYAD